LTFEGEQAVLRHQQGLVHLAWLLANPGGEPIHALELAGRIAAARRREIHGLAPGLAEGAVVRQRSVSMDLAAASRALLRRQRELELVLEDDRESEPVKAEAQRDLEALMLLQKNQFRRAADASTRAAHAVRKSIHRLHRRLAESVDARGRPHVLLRAFAAHIEKYLLVPSRRWAGWKIAGGHAGCFIYEPPPGIVWKCD
jgi:hypothetical protein